MTKQIIPPLFGIDTKHPLNLINESDFVRPALFGQLGRGLLPSSDRDEIIERQKVFKVLFSNPELTEWLYKNLVLRSMGSSLPDNGSDFLAYFHKDNQKNFWVLAKELLKFLEITPLQNSVWLSALKNKLTTLIAKQTTQEDLLVREVTEELHKLVHLQGTLTFELSKNAFIGSASMTEGLLVKSDEIEKLIPASKIKESMCFGWKEYSFMYSSSSISPGQRLDVPDYGLFKKLFNWRKLKRIRKHNQQVEERRRQLQKEIDYSTQLFKGETVPDGIVKDISRWVFDTILLQKNVGQNEFDPYVQTLNASEVLNVRIIFSLHGKELSISVADAWVNIPASKRTFNGDAFANFKGKPVGYTDRQFSELQDKYTAFKNSVLVRTFAGFENHNLFSYLFRKEPRLKEGSITIPAMESTANVVYATHAQLLASPKFKDRFRSITRERIEAEQAIFPLGDFTAVVKGFQSYKKQLGDVLWTFPEILPEGAHQVSFETLTPVHLIGRNHPTKKKLKISAEHLIPIKSVGHLKGNIVCLTGQNAGGKTTTLEEMIGAIYIAQTGLPIPGTEMSLNPKKAIAMVFMERGEGSTLQLLYEKTKVMLEEVQKIEEGGIIVFMDELGSATQESSGYAFGKKVLATLLKQKCSVVCSTQIGQLAQYVRENGGACYQFDNKHRMLPGIGDGNAEWLRKELGLEKLLVEA